MLVLKKNLALRWGLLLLTNKGPRAKLWHYSLVKVKSGHFGSLLKANFLI